MILFVARWRIRRVTVVVWNQSTPEPTVNDDHRQDRQQHFFYLSDLTTIGQQFRHHFLEDLKETNLRKREKSNKEEKSLSLLLLLQ